MAETKTINTRIISKNGLLTAWEGSALPLHEGEIALAKVMVPQPDGTVAPTYVAKIGIEGKTFNESPMLFAPASDVYSWAKKADPTIDELPTNLKTAIKDLQTAVGSVGSVADAIKAAIEALDGVSSGEGAFVKAVTQTDGKISVTYGKAQISEIEGLTAKLTEIDNSISGINTKLGTTTDVTGDIAKAKKAGDDAQQAFDAYEAAHASDYTNSAIDTAISDAVQVEKERATGIEGGLDTRIATLEQQIVGVTGAMHFKGTLQQLPTDTSSYVSGDVIAVGSIEYVFNGTEFVELGDVTAQGQRISTLETAVNTTIPANYVTKEDHTDDINTVNTELAKKALGSDLTALTGRVTEAEETLTTHGTDIDKNATDITNLTERVQSIETDYIKNGDTIIINCGGPTE